MVDAGVFGRGSMHSVLSACFLPSGIVLTGVILQLDICSMMFVCEMSIPAILDST
jgi:hypothetical protein